MTEFPLIIQIRFLNEFSLAGVRSLTNRRTLVTLTVGVLVGFSMAALCLRVNNNSVGAFDYLLDGPSADHHHEGHGHAHSGAEMKNAEGPEKDGGQHDMHDQAHAMENASVANKLYDEVRVLCWIMTNPANHKKKARHVKRTWGKRCNILVFMSTAEGERKRKAWEWHHGRGIKMMFDGLVACL